MPTKSASVTIPFKKIAKETGTPVYIYSRETIEERIHEVKVFDTVRFAQKACSNTAILYLMKKEGIVVDAVSAGEIYRALKAGFETGPGKSDITYTADIFDADARELIKQHTVPVNVGSPDMIAQLAEFSPNSDLILRINPGFGHGHSQKVNTGGDLSKHGIWHEDIPECLSLANRAGLKVKGLHMHIGSGSDFKHLSQVCEAMVLAAEKAGPHLEMISAGGGLPIPYNTEEKRIDVKQYFDTWDKARKRIEQQSQNKINLEVEPGRYLVAESGFLLTQICSVKNTGGNHFYLVDAGFNDLIRPAMYGAYHEISVVHADESQALSDEKEVIVAGPLCESCDVFTQDAEGYIQKKSLPEAVVGDYVLIHDAGAYGASMSSNYNTKKLAPEVLTYKGDFEIIRERQTFSSILQFEKIPESLQF